VSSPAIASHCQAEKSVESVMIYLGVLKAGAV